MVGWGGSGQKKRDKPGRDHVGDLWPSHLLIVSSDELDQVTVTTCTATKKGGGELNTRDQICWSVTCRKDSLLHSFAFKSPLVEEKTEMCLTISVSAYVQEKKIYSFITLFFLMLCKQCWVSEQLTFSQILFKRLTLIKNMFTSFWNRKSNIILPHSLSGLCWEALIKSHHVPIERLQLTD